MLFGSEEKSDAGPVADFLHRSFSIIRRGIHSLSTTVVENREMRPEGKSFHRSVAEGEAMEPTAGIEPATC
jgi:hypothetical protein